MAEFKNKEVANKYDLQNWTGGDKQVFGNFGTVDLQAITVAEADRLVNRGFSKFTVKKEKAAVPATASKK